MKINIDDLTEPELTDLNHRVVERLRFLHQMRAHMTMLEFKIGDRVVFEADPSRRVEGTVKRYNKKTVTVITDCGHRWTVSPHLLRRATPQKTGPDMKNVTPRAGPLHFSSPGPGTDTVNR